MTTLQGGMQVPSHNPSCSGQIVTMTTVPMTSRGVFSILSAATMFVPLFFCGCGTDGPNRIPLNGTVTTESISGGLNGTIALLPAAGTRGPAANGLIQDGTYSFSDEDGPVAGLHRVLIDVEPPRGKMDDADNAGLQWKFEFEETVPVSGPFELNFTLVRENSNEP